MGSKKIIKNKSRKAAIYKGVKCLNCGQFLELTDKYCSNCSQLNSTKQLSISDFFNEFFSSIFTYDSRLRHTLKDLLFKPGLITKNYVTGQRLKYANPFRFYLSVSIIYFILQGFSSGNDMSEINSNDEHTYKNDFLTVNSKNFKQENAYFDIDSLNREIDSIVKSSIDYNKQKDTISSYLPEAKLKTFSWPKRFVKRFNMYQKFYENTQIKNPVKALDSLKHKQTKLNKWLYSKNEVIERIKENPSSFLNYLMTKVPFFLFFFAPFFALFFWVLYSTKKYNYTEHLIFIFHIFSFVFLAGVLAYFPDLLLGDKGYIASIIYLLIGPFYFYKALRNFYKQSRVLTVFKFVILNFLFFIGTLITATLFFTATAAVY